MPGGTRHTGPEGRRCSFASPKSVRGLEQEGGREAGREGGRERRRARERGRIQVLCASMCKFCIMIYTPRYTGNPSVSCLCRSLCLCLCLSPRSHGNSQKPAATGFDGRTDRRRQPLVTATDPSFRIWSGHRAINFYNLLQRYATTFYKLYNLLSHGYEYFKKCDVL